MRNSSLFSILCCSTYFVTLHTLSLFVLCCFPYFVALRTLVVETEEKSNNYSTNKRDNRQQLLLLGSNCTCCSFGDSLHLDHCVLTSIHYLLRISIATKPTFVFHCHNVFVTTQHESTSLHPSSPVAIVATLNL